MSKLLSLGTNRIELLDSSLVTENKRIIYSTGVPTTKIDGSLLVVGDILVRTDYLSLWFWNGTYWLSAKKDFGIWLVSNTFTTSTSTLRRGVSGERKHFIHSVDFSRISFGATSSNNGDIILVAKDCGNTVRSQITIANTYTDSSASQVIKQINSVLDTTIAGSGKGSIMELLMVNSTGTAPSSSGQFGCLISYSEILS